MCMGGGERRGGRGMVTVSVGGVEMGGGLSVEGVGVDGETGLERQGCGCG